MIHVIFKMLKQLRSGNSHVTQSTSVFPPHPVPGGMRSRFLWNAEPPNNGPPSIWDTHGFIGETFFLQIQWRLLQHFICTRSDPWRKVEQSKQSDIDQFLFLVVRNMCSAHSQFPVIIQTERMVDRTGEPVEEMISEERESSSAQIRTEFNEQRKTIIAECCEKVSHHELLAAHAEEERRILREELWRQQKDFSRGSSTKSYGDGGITKIPEFYLRYAREAHRGPEHYYGIIWKITRIAE